jgi:hypothetical protein
MRCVLTSTGRGRGPGVIGRSPPRAPREQGVHTHGEGKGAAPASPLEGKSLTRRAVAYSDRGRHTLSKQLVDKLDAAVDAVGGAKRRPGSRDGVASDAPGFDCRDVAGRLRRHERFALNSGPSLWSSRDVLLASSRELGSGPRCLSAAVRDSADPADCGGASSPKRSSAFRRPHIRKRSLARRSADEPAVPLRGEVVRLGSLPLDSGEGTTKKPAPYPLAGGVVDRAGDPALRPAAEPAV